MKTILYKDTATNEVKTFEELRSDYAQKHDSDLPIDDGTMQLIIYENLTQNGGNLSLIKDFILDWCNDYANYNEAARYLSRVERDDSVKTLYLNILTPDWFSSSGLFKSAVENLENDADGIALYNRLVDIWKSTWKYKAVENRCDKDGQ